MAEFSWCKLCALCRQGILVYSFCTVSFGGVGWSPGVTITTESCMYVFLGRTMLKWIPCFPACCVWLTASLPYATAALTQGDYGSRRKKKIHLLMLSQQFLRTSSTWRSVVFRWSSQAGECWTKKGKKMRPVYPYFDIAFWDRCTDISNTFQSRKLNFISNMYWRILRIF